MTRLKTTKLAMIEDDIKGRYGADFADFTPTSKSILFGMVDLVRDSLDRILYRHKSINWVVDEEKEISLVTCTSGAMAFALALEACRYLAVVYTRDDHNMLVLTTDDLYDQLGEMHRLANKVNDWSWSLIARHKTDEPPRRLQFAVRQTKKNRFKI